MPTLFQQAVRVQGLTISDRSLHVLIVLVGRELLRNVRYEANSETRNRHSRDRLRVYGVSFRVNATGLS